MYNIIPQLISPLASPAYNAYNLDLIDKTPPQGSLASALLDLPKLSGRKNSALSNLKDIVEPPLEFKSCASSISSSEGSDLESKPVQKSHKKQKRKKILRKKRFG